MPRYISTIALALALAGCGKAEPRSRDYFGAHLDEARDIAVKCRTGSVRGEECANADYAVQLAEAKERGARFFRIKPEQK